MNTKTQWLASDFVRSMGSGEALIAAMVTFGSVEEFAACIEASEEAQNYEIVGNMADAVTKYAYDVIRAYIMDGCDLIKAMADAAEMFARYDPKYAETLASYQAMAEDAELTRIADERLKSPQGVVTVSIDDL
ncbi:MAG: hypothetical protein ACRC9N_07275 [Aeromonas sp.]